MLINFELNCFECMLNFCYIEFIKILNLHTAKFSVQNYVLFLLVRFTVISCV